MEYVVVYVKGDDIKIISRHETKEDALKAGDIANKSKTGDGVISCIYGNISDDGTINGRHYMIKTWIFRA